LKVVRRGDESSFQPSFDLLAHIAMQLKADAPSSQTQTVGRVCRVGHRLLLQILVDSIDFTNRRSRRKRWPQSGQGT